jgi:predicted CXXCH cytochrome family protein
LKFVALFVFVCAISAAADNSYLGRTVCAGCHKSIAATQAQTAMAQTWQGTSPHELPSRFKETHSEGPAPAAEYVLEKDAAGITYTAKLPEQPEVSIPVEITMGGKRHGISFLARLNELSGSRLARPPLIETRYLHYAPQNRLELSPGFPKDKPASYETALGRVLTPRFEEKCLACHGAPRAIGTHQETGVSCESCHGPGRPHVAALAVKSADKQILNPEKLPATERMKPCAQCHSGFSQVQDPLPDDLLISDQVTALSNSECWRQSGGQIDCVSCHDPHQDAPRAALVAKSEKTCLSCHNNAAAQHPALCPVNRIGGCIGCHMPDSNHSAPFVIADHWIRVHPEQNVPGGPLKPEWRSTLAPKHEYLRLIALDDVAKAAAIRDQLVSGASFFDLARANSSDAASARNGGYLGDLESAQLDPAWAKAALALAPGEISPVVSSANKSYIVERLPRDFREQAGQHFDHAMELRRTGNREQSAAELIEALKIYPQFLRALTFLAISQGEAGNAQASAGILNVALHYYPNDPGAHFNLAIAYGALGREDEITEYKSALALDPDYVPAYLNWGASLFTKGRYAEAEEIYREGIRVNPLVASLHYSLSLALERDQKSAEAQAELALARKIDPAIGTK